jgi:hypothetical protein
VSAQPGADERRIRNLLRRQGVGPDANPAPMAATPAREPDWLDRLYADEAPDDQPDTDPGERPRWYSVRKTPHTTAEPPPAAVPGVHVTITPTAAAAISPRRARARWWVLRRGTAAGAGWALGLGPATAGALDEAAHGGVVLGLMLYGAAWYGGLRLQRLVPAQAVDEVHTAADWAAQLPSATVLLALALHTPGALT